MKSRLTYEIPILRRKRSENAMLWTKPVVAYLDDMSYVDFASFILVGTSVDKKILLLANLILRHHGFDFFYFRIQLLSVQMLTKRKFLILYQIGTFMPYENSPVSNLRLSHDNYLQKRIGLHNRHHKLKYPDTRQTSLI